VNILDRAKPARAEGPAHILVHGEAGAGKTYAVRTLPAPHDQILVLACEPGARSLSDTEIPVLPIRSVADLRAVLVELRQTDRFSWVVIDSLSELATIVLREEQEANKDGRLAYGVMAGRVRTIVAGFLALNRNTLWIARQDCDIDAQSGRVTRRYPSMPGKLLALRQPIAHDFDFVLCLTAKKRGDGVARVFQTSKLADPACDAKVRDPRGLLDPFEPADFGKMLAKVASEESE